jgi:hypothetical protein
MAQQEIDVQTPFVSFIDDQRVVFRQQRLALHLGQQDAVRHELDVGRRTRTIVEPDLASNLLAPLHVQFLRDPAGNGERRHPARLRAADLRFDAKPGLQTHLGNLRGLPGTSFSGNNDHWMRANRGDDVVLAVGDR